MHEGWEVDGYVCVGSALRAQGRRCKGLGAEASSTRSWTQKNKVWLEDLKMEMVQNAVERQAELKVIRGQS